MLTQTFLNSSTLEKNSFIRKMETSVYYPLMSLSWLYKQCYKTLNLSCQVRVLAKAFKQAICQVTNPCRQNLLMMNYCTHYELENLFHHSHTRPCYRWGCIDKKACGLLHRAALLKDEFLLG